MRSKIYSTIRGIAALALMGVGFLSSCQDDWDAHYNQQAGTDTGSGSSSLYEIISLRPELSDFREVLDAARLFSNNRETSVSYKQLLERDQFFTVWAPVNGSFNKDSLLHLCATSEGDSLVERHFLKNHIARFGHPVNGKDGDIQMLNGKLLQQGATSFGEKSFSSYNISARNGILHVMQQPATYYYNIYEALISLDKYRHLGDFLRSYQIDEFDEMESLPKGVEDGKTVYVDSVFKTHNILLGTRVFGVLDSEDSTYWMVAPTRQVWDSIYAEAKTYYNYVAVEKADSLHELYSHYALMQDLVFNPGVQKSIKDSLCSTTWIDGGKYHTYYKPFEPGGLFSRFSNEMECSNGRIHEVDFWPYDKTQTYFTKITKEAEYRMYDYKEPSTAGNKNLTIATRSASADSISDNGYVAITPQTASSAYYVTYELPNVLSGTYDVCVVMLPKSVYYTSIDPNTTDGRRHLRPNKFDASITYLGTDGKEYTVQSNRRYSFDPSKPGYYVAQGNTDTSHDFLFNCNFNPTAYATRAFTNDPLRVDTIHLCTMSFPTCNYAAQKVTNRITITNNIRSNQTNTYNPTMFIDCFLLLPHVKE